MTIPQPAPGLVISYAYLWAEEFNAGRREATKDRPAAIILTRAHLAPAELAYVVPITHVPPSPGQHDRIEIPAAIKRRLGLDESRSWVVISEFNVFVWPGPDLRPIVGTTGRETRWTYGFLPQSFFTRLKHQVLAAWREKRMKTVKREVD